MYLTRKRAIQISIELWTWLAESGSDNKEDWSGWKEYGYMCCDCPLCEYRNRQEDKECESCPYFQQFGSCIAGQTLFVKWDEAGTVAERQQYARQFLEQLKQL